VGLEYKVFSYENGLKFFKRVSIFPEIGVSPKKGLRFLHGLLDAVFLGVSPGYMPSASYPATDKLEGGLLVLFLGLGLSIGPP